MIYGSVCSGIEAATHAWHPLGWTPAFFSEIEKFPSAVLAHHYGSNMPGEAPTSNGVPNLGDMTKFEEWPDYAIDLLVGGTPCQSFSVGGRAGIGVGAIAHAIQAGATRENPDSGPDGVGVQEGIAYTLEARQEVQAVQSAWAVRRLTPTECHRLQGFKDGFCNIPWRGKDESPDGPQYKALGNSMAVNVMRWIGQRIQMVEDICKELAA